MERVLKVLKFDAPSARGGVAASPQILKNAFLSSLLLAHPHSGVGGERSETEGGGFAMGHSVARVQRIQAAIGLRPGRPGFGPQSGLVQRGVLYATCGGRKTIQPP